MGEERKGERNKFAGGELRRRRSLCRPRSHRSPPGALKSLLFGQAPDAHHLRSGG